MMSFAENRYRVLLVEDDATVASRSATICIRKVSKRELSPRGGREALERLVHAKPGPGLSSILF